MREFPGQFAIQIVGATINGLEFKPETSIGNTTSEEK